MTGQGQRGYKRDTSSATALVSVAPWPLSKNRTTCLWPPPLPLIPSLYRSFSCSRAGPGVYFHGWGVKTAVSLFWLAAPFPEEGGVRSGALPKGVKGSTWPGGMEKVERPGGGGRARCGLSDRVRRQLQEGGCRQGGHVVVPGDVRVFPLASL